MKYAQWRKHDIANGPGVRTTLFVSGCTHYCKGCFNQMYWDFDYGNDFTKEFQDSLIEEIKQTGHFSLLGGEPFQAGPEILQFLKRVKSETTADVWCWSGYKLEEILESSEKHSYRKDMLKYIDILVDGKFQECNKNITLKYRGSSNQRVIDIKKTSDSQEIVLYDNM